MRATEALDQLGWIPKDDSEKTRYLIAKKQWDELVKLGVPAVGSLIETLEDEDINIDCGATIRESVAVREGAAEALGKIRDKRAVEPLTNALKDGLSHVRYYAARALGEIGDPRAIGPLTQALKDNDEGVRVEAKKALEKIREKNI